MSEKRINEYIEGKYGKFGVDRYVRHSNSSHLTTPMLDIYYTLASEDQEKKLCS